jgi:hypothetical protein
VTRHTNIVRGQQIRTPCPLSAAPKLSATLTGCGRCRVLQGGHAAYIIAERVEKATDNADRRRRSVMARLTLMRFPPPRLGVNDCKHHLSSPKRHHQGNRARVPGQSHAAAMGGRHHAFPCGLHRRRAELGRQSTDCKASARLVSALSHYCNRPARAAPFGRCLPRLSLCRAQRAEAACPRLMWRRDFQVMNCTWTP